MLSLPEVAQRFEDPQQKGSYFIAKCPCHDDNRRSLSIYWNKEQTGIRITCHAGCDWQQVAESARLTNGDLNGGGDRGGYTHPSHYQAPKPKVEPRKPGDHKPKTIETDRKPNRMSGPATVVAEYVYETEHGDPYLKAIKMEPKSFYQRHWSGGAWRNGGVDIQVPYRLPEFLEHPDRPVFVVEGEKDVEAIRRGGFLATCNAGGAGKWTADHAQWLQGRTVYVLPDNDEPGRHHAEVVRESLLGVATACYIVELPGIPPKGDVSDWLEAGNTTGDLARLASQAAKPMSRTVSELVDAYLARLEADQGAADLIDTGLADLDQALNGGIAPGELVIVAARPSEGKSALALQWLMDWAEQGKTCLFFSEEMTGRQVAERVIARCSKERKREWPFRIEEVKEKAAKSLKRGGGEVMVHAPVKTARALDAVVHKYVLEHGVDVVAVDYAQLLKGDGRGEYEKLSNVSSVLQGACRSTGATFIVLAQVGRSAVVNGKEYDPQLSDLKGSGQLEQDADVVIFAHRPCQTKPTRRKEEFLLYARKNRNRGFDGATVEVVFDASRQTFKNVKSEGPF